jgi:hypothetical protein
MRGGFRHIALPLGSVLGLALTLAGCGFADVRSPVPEFMRREPEAPPQLESPPDIKRLVHDHLDAVFVANSYPRGVQVSPPTHELRGTGWTACVRAEVNSATGNSLGVVTYRISIIGGVISDRRRADPDDNCTTESYEPI